MLLKRSNAMGISCTPKRALHIRNDCTSHGAARQLSLRDCCIPSLGVDTGGKRASIGHARRRERRERAAACRRSEQHGPADSTHDPEVRSISLGRAAMNSPHSIPAGERS
jgi:hypothetical protein